MTKGDYSELAEFIGKRFDSVEAEIGDMRHELSEVHQEINSLTTGLDAYAKKADTYFQEMLMLATKVDRHEKWLHQVAEKLGVKLEY